MFKLGRCTNLFEFEVWDQNIHHSFPNKGKLHEITCIFGIKKYAETIIYKYSIKWSKQKRRLRSSGKCFSLIENYGKLLGSYIYSINGLKCRTFYHYFLLYHCIIEYGHWNILKHSDTINSTVDSCPKNEAQLSKKWVHSFAKIWANEYDSQGY